MGESCSSCSRVENESKTEDYVDDKNLIEPYTLN